MSYNIGLRKERLLMWLLTGISGCLPHEGSSSSASGYYLTNSTINLCDAVRYQSRQSVHDKGDKEDNNDDSSDVHQLDKHCSLCTCSSVTILSSEEEQSLWRFLHKNIWVVNLRTYEITAISCDFRPLNLTNLGRIPDLIEMRSKSASLNNIYLAIKTQDSLEFFSQ